MAARYALLIDSGSIFTRIKELCMAVISRSWGNGIIDKTTGWLTEIKAARGVKSAHFWIILVLFALKDI